MPDGNRIARTGQSLERRSGWIIVAFISITLLLLIPLVALATDDEYAGEPGGEVFDLRDEINDRFAPSIHASFFLVESRDGDILTQAPLLELYRNEDALRQADGRGELRPKGLPAQPYLFQGFAGLGSTVSVCHRRDPPSLNSDSPSLGLPPVRQSISRLRGRALKEGVRKLGGDPPDGRRKP